MVKPKVKLKLNVWPIVSEAVERGINYGYQRAYKHTDEPSEETLKDEINRAVMNELSEVVAFDD